jgi:bifunctional N-acetylglucosamine-1-phosphate-uridyltransferase/glucosamine-1-phosphate-acetyltransferase GlmU-like protein
VVIGPGVSIADGAVIHSFSHIVQASIGKNASVGPYARLRPGTSLGEGARIGNFVETKAATLEAGVKVNRSAPARSSARIRRWWRRCKSAAAPISVRDR